MENFDYDYVRIFSFHLSEAFDRLRHLDIIDTLRRMNPTRNPFVINVVIDFLKGRTQRVVFQADISDSTNNSRSAQGVISPAYYLSVADIHSVCITEIAFSSFADDINVLCIGFFFRTAY